MNVEAPDLRRMSSDELDELFRKSPTGTVPVGRSKGTAIVAPGSLFGRATTGLIRLFAWKGKVFWRGKEFDSERNTLRNLITPFGIRAFPADVYVDDSWFAEGQAIILDYSNSGFLVRRIRDEIRQVANGLYLGQVFWGRKRVLMFILKFANSR